MTRMCLILHLLPCAVPMQQLAFSQQVQECVQRACGEWFALVRKQRWGGLRRDSFW
jgi:hypothetical protein